MKLISIRTNHGPSVYHAKPTLIMTVNLEEAKDTASTDVPNFTDNLIATMPGLKKHTCSPGYEGGFVERLYKGTYMAHIIEHVALELSTLAGIEVSYGKTRYAGSPGKYEVVTRFTNEEGMKECLRVAFSIVTEILQHSKPVQISESIERIKEIVCDTKLGPSGQALADAAAKKGIPYRRIGKQSLLQLGYGKKIRRVQAAVSSQTNLISVEIAQDKDLTKALLSENFIPVPEGVVVSSLAELNDAMESIPAPYAVKPLDGNHGNGVALNLITPEEVQHAFEIAQSYGRDVLIEEMCQGRDYRVLLVNGKVVAAAERKPPSVIGDGAKSILQLIEEINTDPKRGDGHQNILSKIEVDEVMLAHLKKQNMSLDYKPSAGETVTLRQNANLSSGGTAVDVTDKMHPEVISMCERAARVVGLDICGLDVIHPDISTPPERGAKIIEVNAGPGLRMHLAPSEGKARPVGDEIIGMLYPQPEDARIPIISVTGTNGKTTTVRMIHKVFSDIGDRTVGLTTTDGIWIGRKKVFTGDTTGPKSSQLVLSDTSVDMAVLEVARGGLLRGGLAYDYSDVSVITNIREDHIGQNGIEDLEDILWIKSLVAERVKKNGHLVLNADDPVVLSLRTNSRVVKQEPKFFLFSLSAHNSEVKNHIAKDGSACWLEKNFIMVYHNGVTEKFADVTEFPATMGGVAHFQILNVMSTIAASLAGGATKAQIIASLKQFRSTQENLGRFNIYKIHEGYVILDYGHNEDALNSMGKILDRLPGYKKTAVIGLPGDRSDELLKNSAKIISKHFDQFVLKDDLDLRGRSKSEIPTLIEQTVLSHNPKAKVQIILNEVEAIHSAVNRIEKNEIVVIFYDELQAILPVLLQYDPLPVDQIPSLMSHLEDEDHDLDHDHDHDDHDDDVDDSVTREGQDHKHVHST